MIPIVADEAYFVGWGSQLSAGYYDHPPLTGWISWFLTRFSESGYVHRFFSFLLGILSTYLIYRFVRQKHDTDTASYIAVFFLLLPANIIVFSIFTNDTILYFAMLLFFLSFSQALRFYSTKSTISYWYAAFSGLSFGLALLIKYSASIYFLAITFFLIINWKSFSGFLFRQYFLMSVISAAIFSSNLLWNYNNCAVNLAFNFLFRQSETSLIGVLELVIALFVLVGPVAFVLCYKRIRSLPSIIQVFRYTSHSFFTQTLLTTLIVVAIIAFFRGKFSTHWGLPLIILATLAIAENIHILKIEKILSRRFLFISTLFTIFLGMFFLLKTYPQLSLHIAGERSAFRFAQIVDIENRSLLENIERDHADKILATSSYGTSSMLANNTRLPTTVIFNSTSKYGRNHDIFENYAAYDGKDFLFLETKPKADRLKSLMTYFEKSSIIELNGDNGRYLALVGESFKFDKYRDEQIQRTLDTLYDRIPPWLYRSCFMEKYDR